MKYELKPYKVIIKVKVEKFISKLDKKLQIRSIKEIEKLAKYPVPKNKNHILALRVMHFYVNWEQIKLDFIMQLNMG